MAAEARFYVYELGDPRSGAVFYVGKGVKDRISQHEAEAMRGVRSKKCDLIREIREAGLLISKTKIAFFFEEQDAYDFETERILEYGLKNLTNVLPGGQKAWAERERVFAHRKLVKAYTAPSYLRYIATWVKARCGARRDYDGWPFAKTLWTILSNNDPAPRLRAMADVLGAERMVGELRRFGVELT